MTDEQINAAIAKACGFVCLHEFQVEKDGAKFGFWEYPPTWTGPKKQPWCLDFCTDLNAMHEAEKVLQQLQPTSMRHWLEALCKKRKLGNFWQAPARERAEAFLRTLDKWEDK